MFDENSPLYDIPIETLDLSESALDELKRVGMTSIGDCLLFYTWRGNATIQVRGNLIEPRYTEIKQKLQQHGYVIPDEPDA
jgi:DNA-directed RNA polymerase alpha subunit